MKLTKRILRRIGYWRWKLQMWLYEQECPKEQAGYTCHHRVMSNGKLECGYE